MKCKKKNEWKNDQAKKKELPTKTQEGHCHKNCAVKIPCIQEVQFSLQNSEFRFKILKLKNGIHVYLFIYSFVSGSLIS